MNVGYTFSFTCRIRFGVWHSRLLRGLGSSGVFTGVALIEGGGVIGGAGGIVSGSGFLLKNDELSGLISGITTGIFCFNIFIIIKIRRTNSTRWKHLTTFCNWFDYLHCKFFCLQYILLYEKQKTEICLILALYDSIGSN